MRALQYIACVQVSLARHATPAGPPADVLARQLVGFFRYAWSTQRLASSCARSPSSTSRFTPAEDAARCSSRARRALVGQGRGRAARDLPPRGEPRRRPARAARARRARGGPGRPPGQARAHRPREGERLVERADRGADRARSSACSDGFTVTSAQARRRARRDPRAAGDRALLPARTAGDDPPARDHRAEPQVVDARRDELRALHDHARQHGRERRAAVDPVGPRRLAVGARVDRSTPTR